MRKDYAGGGLVRGVCLVGDLGLAGKMGTK